MNDKRTIRLLDKISACLEDGDWQKADELCEAVIETDSENAEAYLGKLMAEREVKTRDELKNCDKPLEESDCYHKIISNGDEELVELLKSANDSIKKAAEDKAKKQAVIKKAVKIGAPIVAAVAAALLLIFCLIIPTAEKNEQYKEALELVQSGEVQDAMCIFKELGGFKDSAEQLKKLRFDFAHRATVSVGANQAVAVGADGKVYAVYNSEVEPDISGWANVIAVDCGAYNTVALKADGTAAAVMAADKKYDYGQNNVSGWTDIIAVSAGEIHTVGLKADGTVVAVGNNDCNQLNVSEWRDIVSVSAGGKFTVGLKADGTVVAVGDNSYNQLDVAGWTDIVAVSASEAHTVGLKADGTVVVTDYSDNYYRSQSDATLWTDIVAVSAGSNYTVGLKSDGSVVAIGVNKTHQIDVDDWKDIVAISAGDKFVAGLKADGTVVSTGSHIYNSAISGWKNIKLPDSAAAKQ